MAETLAATARLKRVGALGWKEKAAFLEFRKLKGRRMVSVYGTKRDVSA
jgi:hypothetical protein